MIKTPEVLALAGGMAVICITSLAQFPMFLARTAVIVIGFFACFERLAVEH
jgi:hypothetical protein